MARSVLEESNIHTAIRAKIANHESAILDEVKAAIKANAVLIVGMGQNPFPKKARKLLDGKGVAFKYLEYGNYLKDWRRRNALKMWTGWPTLPMIFVKGQLIGGADDLAKLLDSGEFERLLKA
jgi:monothiol glutaredoxin